MALKRPVGAQDVAVPVAEPTPKAARLEVAPPAAAAKGVTAPPAASAKTTTLPPAASAKVSTPLVPPAASAKLAATPKVPPTAPKAAASAAPAIEETEKDDAASDRRKRLAAPISYEPQDTTLNVIPANNNRMLAALTDGGLGYLMAAARASVGAKMGRYYYEVKIIEMLSPHDGQRTRISAKQALRVGFSAPGSSLYLGETEDSICFDAEGHLVIDQKRTSVSQKIGKHQVVGVLLNLDKKSDNVNTVSLFIDGVRVAKPQPLPESLVDKPLCPHVSWRNLTLQTNFGPEPMAPLPFKATMWQQAAQVDMAVTAGAKKTKDGKFEVVFPVGVPDEGTFLQLDQFLEDNPHFVELSDRKLVEWAVKSGLAKPKINPAKQHSNDKPEMHFGLPMLDELQLRRVIASIAPVIPRNYIVMEVKSNLVKADRSELVKKFSGSQYKRIARVCIGEPPASFKDKVLKVRVKAKQDVLDTEHKVRMAEKERKKLVEEKKREMLKKREALQKAREEVEAARKKELEEAKKKAEAEEQGEGAEQEDSKMEDAEEKVETEPEAKAKEEAKEETKPEEVKDEQKDETKEEVKEEEEEEEEEVPVAELTEEEKAHPFLKTEYTDLSSAAFSQAFAKFSLPAKAEGFDQIQWAWQNEDLSGAYLTKWVTERKLTTRIEDLQPSSWFQERLQEWQKLVQEWQQKQKNFKQQMAAKKAAKKEVERKAKAEAEAAKAAAEAEAEVAKAAAEAEAEAEAAKVAAPFQGGEAGGAEGQDGKDKEDKAKEDKDKEKQEGEEKPAEPEEKKEEKDMEVEKKEDEQKEEPEPEEEDFGKAITDVLGVEDVDDIGGGEPLFSNFCFEDWSLMGLRFELHLLVQAFRHDVYDPERPGITEENVPFYFQKYFRKPLNTRFFGMETVKDLTGLVKDVVEFRDQVLASKLDESGLDNQFFVKLTEDARRTREARLEAGDDTVKLKFNVMAAVPADAAGKAGQRPVLQRPFDKGGFEKGNWGAKGWNKGYKGGYKGYNKGGFKGGM